MKLYTIVQTTIDWVMSNERTNKQTNKQSNNFLWAKQKSKTCLDRGFDLTSLPDASLPLLLLDGINDDVFSCDKDGLGTRLLPVFSESERMK